MTQLDLAKHRLFDADALNVSNIKVFPGTSRDTSAEQLAGELNRALSRLEAGDYEIVASPV